MVIQRYRPYFRDIRVTRDDGMWEMKYQCLRCEKVISRNAAGAQSHIAKHLREVERELTTK